MNDVEYTDGKAISNAFAAFFSSVCVEDYPDSENIRPEICKVSEVFCIKQVDYEDVCDAARGLKINKAVGPDNISSYVLKGIIGFLAEPLKTIFNISLRRNTFPQVLKELKIFPIF